MISSAARKGRRKRKGKEAIIESREGERELHAAAAVDFQNWVTQSPRRVRARERAKERGARGAPSLPAPREERESAAAATATSSPLPSCAIRPSVAAEETGFPFPFSCCGRRRTNQRRTNERTADDRTTRRDANQRTNANNSRRGAAGGLAGQTCKTWQNVPSPVFHPSFLAASLSS